MKLEFKNVLNRHKGRPALILAHGPSLDKIRHYINRRRDWILIGCNRWHMFYDVPPHYWVTATPGYSTVERQIDKINQYKDKTTLVYADSVDLVDRDWVASAVKAD